MSDIKMLIESAKFAPLSQTDGAAMKVLLQNTHNELQNIVNEGTFAGDVQQFTPILLPLVRRVYPNLIANELLGLQTMTMPTGYIYAMVNQYVGTDLVNGKADPNSSAKIFIMEDDQHGLAVTDAFTDGHVLYVEGEKVLATGTAVVGDTVGGKDITSIYSNEAAFGRILKNYTGSYATADAEKLGKDMREVGFTIARKSVEARSRALKGQYSVELYQDLKAQHGLLADEEIMSLMGYEIQAEIDREVVDFVNFNSTQLADTTFSANPRDSMSGRWEIEKYRREVIRIDREAAQIGIDTKRGQGNILLTSPGVATMLEHVGKFKTAEIASDVIAPVSGGVAGTFNNKYKVILDQYAESDYCTIVYKGADRRDAMGFLAPYVPLSFTKVTHADSGQPAIIAKTRYALSTIPGAVSPESNDRAKTYARSFGIDLSNTALEVKAEI